uniref:ATP synthase F0 subunit 8 n=1 Tax=Pyganodon grandis TaxID=96932 RepID=D2DW40_PYGGR|nr:ATP synthase F0 subunit 8 [Pyganodon grandis]ACQ91057.1 ATP synthase F0 subunit 8 [Pyganodon grandis]UZC55576.1 ATP synthase subunit 8 [Pyganodon grandis]
MPQLSPMSWVMVISMFLVCLIFFAVTMWWLVDGKYDVKRAKNKDSIFLSGGFAGKSLESGVWKGMKWSFSKNNK